VIGIGVCSFLTATRGDWEKCFVPAGLRMRAGEDIFREGYVYPPFQAFFAALFTYAPAVVGRAMWASLNAGAAAVFVLSAWRLSGGAPWWRDRNIPARETWIFGLGFVATIGFLFDAITNSQTDLLLASLIVGGWHFGRRPWSAGLVGLAAAGKCTPLLFVPWVLSRGRWSFAAIVVVVALGVNAAPDVFFPSPTGELRLWTWTRTYFASLLHSNHALGTWFTGLEFNHSLAGALRRLMPAAAVRPVWVAAVACMIFAAAVRIVRSRAVAGAVERFEIGMILCLMVLLSPVSSKPHFSILLLPAWTVAREALLRRDPLLCAATFASVLMGLTANKDLVGAAIYDAAKWSGVITWQSLLLFAASVRAQSLVTNGQSSRDQSLRVGR
jgi:hypothetical protein